MISEYHCVTDFFINPFGEAVYITKNLDDAKEFAKDYIKEFKEYDGKRYVKIITKEGKTIHIK